MDFCCCCNSGECLDARSRSFLGWRKTQAFAATSWITNRWIIFFHHSKMAPVVLYSQTRFFDSVALLDGLFAAQQNLSRWVSAKSQGTWKIYFSICNSLLPTITTFFSPFGTVSVFACGNKSSPSVILHMVVTLGPLNHLIWKQFGMSQCACSGFVVQALVRFVSETLWKSTLQVSTNLSLCGLQKQMDKLTQIQRGKCEFLLVTFHDS